MKALDRLSGGAPEAFTRGRRVELETKNGRLVRGVVVNAGGGLAQLDIGGGRIALIDYDDVARIRAPAADATTGNWMPSHPDRARAAAETTSEWRAWSR